MQGIQITILNDGRPSVVTGSIARSDIVYSYETGALYPDYNPSGFLSELDASGVITINEAGGEVTLSGLGSIFISTGSNSIVYISGQPGGDVSGNYVLTSSSGQFVSIYSETGIITGLPLNVNSAYQNFGFNYSSIPKVFPQIEVSGINPQYSVNTTNITTSGYIAVFSDFIQESGVFLSTFVKQ